MIIFADSSDPVQARHFVVRDLDPICLTLMKLLKQYIAKKLILKKISRRQKSMKKFPPGIGFKLLYTNAESTITSWASLHFFEGSIVIDD